MATRDSAICLKASDYSETSQVIWFLARRSGVVRLIAKGAKRPKSKSGGRIDLLSEGDLVFAGTGAGSLGTLMEFSETDGHLGLRHDAARLYAGQYMLELVAEMLPEADPHPEVFDLLHNGLARLACPDAPVAAVLAYFQWRLLKHAGLLGDLRACAVCGRDVPAGRREVVHFSSRQGGLICRDCEAAVAEKIRLEGAALPGLAALQAARAARTSGRKITMPDEQAHAVNRLLAYHIAEQLGKPLKLARYAMPGLGD